MNITDNSKRQIRPPPRLNYVAAGVSTTVQREGQTRRPPLPHVPEITRRPITPPSTTAPKPKGTSINSSRSSIVQLRLSELDGKKKIRELKKQYQNRIDEAEKLEVATVREVKALTMKLKQLKTGQQTPTTSTMIAELLHQLETAEQSLAWTHDDITRLQNKMQRDLEQLQEDIDEEKERILLENDDNSNLSSDDDASIPETTPDVQNWIDGTDLNEDDEHEKHDQHPRGAAADAGIVSTLVKALDNAFGRPALVNHDGVDKDLPAFSGKPEDWVMFKAAYYRTSSRHRYSGEQNLSRLMKALRGQARSAVKGLFSNPLNVPVILNTLEKEFGCPEFIIETLIDKVESCKPPDFRKPETVKEFARAIQTLESNIRTHDMTSYSNNGYLLKIIVQKLPVDMKEKWVEWVFTDTCRRQDMINFSQWMELQYDKACALHRPQIPDDPPEKQYDRGKRNNCVLNMAAGEDDQGCGYCGKQNHSIFSCFVFKRKSIDDKWKIVREKKLCFCCLGKGHVTAKCSKKKNCDIDGCSRSHHKLLHGGVSKKREEVAHDDDDGGGDKDEKSETQEKAMGTASTVDSLPIIPVIIRGPNGTERIFALLDTGASFSMLEADIADRLGLQGTKESLKFTVFGDRREERNSKKISVEVAGVFKKAPFYNVKAVHTVKKLGIPGRTFDSDEFKRKHPHLNSMNAKSMINAKPQMVIGINAGGLFAARKIIESAPGETPAAIQCLIGWYVLEDPSTVKKQFQFLCRCKEMDCELNEIVRTFFSLESYGVKSTVSFGRSREDRRALELLQQTTKQDGKRWQTGLLWRDDKPLLPESKQMALKRLWAMERKMDKDPKFAELCTQRFAEYKEKGFLLENTLPQNIKQRWYLPWFFALHPSKKPRLVFDAAAKSNGKSLNDFLLKGPDQLRPLPAVLMRFRMHLIGITGDIKEMFHQVHLREEDRPAQTILFRGMDRGAQPKEYQMSVLFFGSASSPCSAIFAKNKNADLFTDKYPVAVRATYLDFYMDDYCGGADTEADAVQLHKQVTLIHQQGGFQVAKWRSSSEVVLNSIPKDIRGMETVSFADKAEVDFEKTLGLVWIPGKDVLGFNVSFSRIPKKLLDVNQRPTKREMVSLIMTIFDPLGFLAPFKIKALIALQQVWRSGVGWDDEIPLSVAETWTVWLKQLGDIRKTRVPRAMIPVSFKNATSVQLHIMCDASEAAYSSVGYLRVITGGSVYVSFVMGKARVAPLKGVTIPRLELQAALIGSRLASTIKAAFDEELKIEKTIFWSDSRTVLCWIRSTSGRFKMFVSNRVDEILENSAAEDWRWVSTSHNAADDATRNVTCVDISSDSRWLRGPSFLKLDERDWPTEGPRADDLDDDIMERKTIGVAVKGKSEELQLPDCTRFSSWWRLLRATATVYVAQRKFRSLLKSREHERHHYITVDDLKRARLEWIKQSQSKCFPQEMKLLTKGEKVGRKSRLFQFTPELNQNGVIVLNGRLKNADRSITVKEPPILDAGCRYTQLMIEWFHKTGQHFGQERVIHLLRQDVWILNCRAAVKKCWNNCLVCKQRTVVPKPPLMGQLPMARLDAGNPPFYHTGVDYFGPLFVKVLRSTVKRWGVVFTCLTTRAVHLELADSLDTSDAINAIVRFVNTRGHSRHIWSDNGTNFVGANREIRQNLLEWNQNIIRAEMTKREIEWHFICPAAPHKGGAWERMVGSAKRILMSLLKEQRPSDGLLRTLFTEVTSILNSRPLTFNSTDPDDQECLTPNHILNLKCVVGPTVAGNDLEGDKLRRSWRYAQRLSEEFWSRWSLEYLPWLAKRNKWHENQLPLQEGDVVIVLEDHAPRNQWKKGIVTKAHRGADGIVRSVTVKITMVEPSDPKKTVKISILKRPVVKICKIGVTQGVEQGQREGECSAEA